MAKNFRRKRWRRPQRMTLEGPVEMRRKDLVVPTVLAIDHEVAAARTRRSIAVVVVTYAAAAVLEGAILAALIGSAVAAVVVAVIAAGYLGSAWRFGDGWLRHALAVRPVEAPNTQSLLRGVATAAGVAAPRLGAVDGTEPNAVAFGVREPWIAITEGAERLGRLELEALVAHEVAHVRDGDASSAGLFVLTAGAIELMTRALSAPGGVLMLLAIPVLPACLAVRLVRAVVFASDREHRADVVGAMLTRYPPAMRRALGEVGADRGSGPTSTDAFWFAPRRPVPGPNLAERARLVGEM